MGLDEDPFDWQVLGDGRVVIFRGGRRVAVVAGRQAVQLLDRLEQGDQVAQAALARVTGNYRRGNER